MIPDKLETKVYCPLSKVQTFWYKALLLKDVNRLANLESSTKGTERQFAPPIYLYATARMQQPSLFVRRLDINPD